MKLNAVSTRDILIQTTDLKAATQFYNQVLGLEIFMSEPAMIGLESGAFRLFLDKAEPYGPVLEFKVDDLEAAKAELVAAGCRIENDDPSVPRCYIRDPFGLIFNIAQKT
ncbi:MAG TPA: VOC family protein [Alphaproteobacteria bacterium]|jgi:catechol 2,3-dioxygenase-like lactoylglutathione lyase family enzyme|nr:VOC family protein [Alphaproteobacteria bacterium]